MAIAARQLAKTRWIRLEWKLGDRVSALRTRPVPLVHLPILSIGTTSPLLRRTALGKAIATSEIVCVSRPRLERKLRNSRAAVGTGPISLVHWP